MANGWRGLPGGSSLKRLLAHADDAGRVKEEEIARWAESHHRRTGRWPRHDSGPVPEAAGMKWSNVARLLREGGRGLPGGSSLPRFLAEHCCPAAGHRSLNLTENRILAWADAHHGRTASWPTHASGPVRFVRGEIWSELDDALIRGLRGLCGGSSLARLLSERRGVQPGRAPTILTIRRILFWADAHHVRTGKWPSAMSGAITGASEDTWKAVDLALRTGSRGLPTVPGSSLAALLIARRGAVVHRVERELTEEQIVAWADAWHLRGEWPTRKSGPIPESDGETWARINQSLRFGRRGLPGGSSLPQLLAQRRGVRHGRLRVKLTVAKILAWADAHRVRSGVWPNVASGPVHEAPGEHWRGLDRALRRGSRGLPSGSSLASLLDEQCGAVDDDPKRRPLDERLILLWADAHKAATGRWPRQGMGEVVGAPDETWKRIDYALKKGVRGLPGGSSLAQFLEEHRGERNPKKLPPLTEQKILAWADVFHQRTGDWPRKGSGPIPEAPGEVWLRVDACLVFGHRGLPGGSSLRKLLMTCRGVARRYGATKGRTRSLPANGSSTDLPGIE